MTLVAGTRLGPYEIVAPLGAGGMGEVYRARDTRLGRDVAVKVLPQHLSSSSEVRARFEREAKTVSSLNHPHICVLHDVGREGETDFLVMELIEGETLAARLSRGALATPEVMKLGAQIADALDRAHRAGVVHRDLKPGNVMLTRSGAKLMDFGLARVLEPGGAAPGGSLPGSTLGRSGLTQSPTRAHPLTAEGTLLGTFQYMAPEQLEGREADARSDLWSLGCVLYEMATGKRAFEGATQASLISAIMRDQPRAMAELSPVTPPALERLVRQCLAKDPDERWQSAGDVRREIEFIASGASGSGGAMAGVPGAGAAHRPRLAIVAWAALATLALIVMLVGRAITPQQEPSAAVLELSPPAPAHMTNEAADVAISPDGGRIVFVGVDSSGAQHLFVRQLDSPDDRMLPETETATRPFWSPDSRWIGYFTQGDRPRLCKVPADGGSPVTLCDASWTRGGSWGAHGEIVFAPSSQSPIMRVPAEGGPVTAATRLDSTRHETSHRFPCFLPDGDHFVYSALPLAQEGWTLWLGSLHSHAVKRLGVAASAATYADPGYLLFVRDRKIVAQRLDLGRLELTGPVTPLTIAPPSGIEDATRVATASSNGRVVTLWRDPDVSHLEWFDRAGHPAGRVPGPHGPYGVVVLSPDQRAAAVTEFTEQFAADALAIDLRRGTITRLPNPRQGWMSGGAWSPDGRTIAVHASSPGRSEEIGFAPADGSASPTFVATSDCQFKGPSAWSADGRWLLIYQIDPVSGYDLCVLDPKQPNSLRPFVAEKGDQGIAVFSPDGKWIAYSSNETGREEVFVRSFPAGDHKTQITTDGGERPYFTQSGRELIYGRTRDNTVHAIPFNPAQPGAAESRTLFKLPFDLNVLGWDVAPEGQRFLVLVPDAASHPITATVITDWTGLLKRR